MTLDPIWLARLFVLAFFAACFLQSSLDKVTDWKGNMEYLSGHFAASPLARLVPLMLLIITLFETAAGVLSAVGLVLHALRPAETFVPVLALCFVAASLVMLFTGQRIAKDYAGAAVLAAYFAVAILGFVLMTP